MAGYAEIAARLERVGQGHLLRFYPELSPERQRLLLERIAGIDLESLPRWIDEYVKRKPTVEIPPGLEPAPYYPHDSSKGGRKWDREHSRGVGEKLLREGKVAAFTVAGGQGSRLGFEGPKGMYPAGAVTGKPLFQIFAEGLLAAGRKYGRAVPWYIMTSPLNHAATVEFFEKSRFYGLERKDVMFFPQGVMPSLEMGTGNVLLAAKDEPATNPDGHGGSIKALWASGAIADMKRRGVEHISYFQVDNPIVRVVDPVFLGLHAAAPDSSAQMSSKMIPKTGPEEKVGVFCAEGGRTLVVEYSDLPRELAEARRGDGGLKFNAGSIAVHVLSVAFVEAMNTDLRFELAFHRADKKVPHVDLRSGEIVQPAHANGVKLERFVFDALPLCRGSIVYETERVEEFAPIKNATGVDSVESSHRIQTERAARWLEAAGVRVPRKADGAADCVLEVSPLTALEAADLRGRSLPELRAGARVVI